MNRNEMSLATGIGLVAAGTLGFALSREYQRRQRSSDDVLTRNIRGVFRKVLHDCSGVDVAVRNGAVTVSGAIQHEELPCLLSAVKRLPGVRCINNQLRLQADAAGVSEPLPETGGQCRSMKTHHRTPAAGFAGLALAVVVAVVASQIVERGFNHIEALNAEDLHFAY